jgi:hypothetical protein
MEPLFLKLYPMILDGTFRKWGHSPYFQMIDQNSEFLSKISSKIM